MIIIIRNRFLELKILFDTQIEMRELKRVNTNTVSSMLITILSSLLIVVNVHELERYTQVPVKCSKDILTDDFCRFGFSHKLEDKSNQILYKRIKSTPENTTLTKHVA